MKAFRSLLVAGLKEFARDRVALFWTLFFPLIFIFLFGIAFSEADIGTFSIGLVLQDDDAKALEFKQFLSFVQVFELHEGSLEEEMAELEDGSRQAVIVVPEGLSQALADEQPLDVQVHYDESQINTAQIVLSIIDQVIRAAEQQFTGRQPILQVETISTQAKYLRQIDYFVPGVLAMSLMQTGLLGSMVLVSLRERRILKRLGATPLSRRSLILAQVIQRLIISVFQAAVILIVGNLVFNVELGERIPLLIGFVLLGSAAFISMGFVVASFARTEEGGIALVQIIQFPMMFLSGIFWPIEFMPAWIRPLIDTLPLTYLGDAMRQVTVEATPIVSLQADTLILVGWLIVSLLVAFRFFRWE